MTAADLNKTFHEIRRSIARMLWTARRMKREARQ